MTILTLHFPGVEAIQEWAFLVVLAGEWVELRAVAIAVEEVSATLRLPLSDLSPLLSRSPRTDAPHGETGEL